MEILPLDWEQRDNGEEKAKYNGGHKASGERQEKCQ